MSFFLADFDYPRNQVITEMLEGIDLGKIKILPLFNKKLFIKKFSERRFIINDFFVSDYETWVIDRGKEKWFYPKSFTYRWRDFINLYYSKYLLADTQTHLDYWQHIYGRTKAKTFILPVLANRKIYKPGSTEPGTNAALKIIFTGTFIPLHGIEIILDAAEMLWREKKIAVQFQIIGQGQTSNTFRRRINNIPIIDFTDAIIPETELVKQINEADVMLGIFGTSRKAASVIPNKVYQGLACRRCVLTMDSPAVREFFSENEIMLVQRDPSKLKTAIEQLHHNRPMLEQLASNGFHSFNNLYDKKRIDFRNFVSEIILKNN